MVIATRESFQRALRIALAGTEIIYFEGLLMREREFGVDCLAAANVAKAVWQAMEAGKVDLFQRRHEDRFIYIARVKKPPHTPVVWKGCYDPKRNSYKHRAREEAQDKEAA